MASTLTSNKRGRINIPKKNFTSVFNSLWEAKERIIVNKGGAGSSKSFSAAQKEVLIAVNRPVTTLVIRKVANTLKKSVIKSFKNRISELKLSEFFIENKTEMTITCTLTGSIFLFMGLDDPEKLKSIEGVDRVFVEEATEITLEDFFELNRRVRGRAEMQLTLNFNPIHEKHWLKKHFFDQAIPNCKIIESTYLDNPFLGEEDAMQLEYMKNYDYNQYRIYALGDWGITVINNPWLFCFKRDRHISSEPLQVIPNAPVHLSFDFNVNPMTCVAFQHTKYYGQGSFVRVLKEFSLPNSTVKDICKAVKTAFPHSVLTVTGDATGRNRNAGYSTGNDNLWKQVQVELKLSASQVLTPGTNPSHKNSRFLCNYLFQEHPNLLIDQSCKGLIDDCMTARPIETENQDHEDKLLKGAGDSEIGYNLFDCLRYYINTHHQGILKK